jgi:hemerythrin
VEAGRSVYNARVDRACVRIVDRCRPVDRELGASMKWSPTLSTGFDFLDAQHQMLFRMADDYAQALAVGRGERVYGLVLAQLTDYARAHFSREEECMERYRCPAAATNLDAHGRFLSALGEYRARYEEAGFCAADAERLCRFVEEWLACHIGRIDVQLRSSS